MARELYGDESDSGSDLDDSYGAENFEYEDFQPAQSGTNKMVEMKAKVGTNKKSRNQAIRPTYETEESQK